MKNFNELNTRVLNWAEEKGIFEKGNPFTQMSKTMEEVVETANAIIANDMPEIKDGFGDILVTVLIGCKMQNLDPLDCLETALDIIEKRTGKMVDGTFVKDK